KRAEPGRRRQRCPCTVDEGKVWRSHGIRSPLQNEPGPGSEHPAEVLLDDKVTEPAGELSAYETVHGRSEWPPAQLASHEFVATVPETEIVKFFGRVDAVYTHCCCRHAAVGHGRSFAPERHLTPGPSPSRADGEGRKNRSENFPLSICLSM